MTNDDEIARLWQAWPDGVPRLSPASNRVLAYVNGRPEGTRAADLVPLLDPTVVGLDREDERWRKVADKGKTYLRRLSEAGRIRCVSIGLYAPQVMTVADSTASHDGQVMMAADSTAGHDGSDVVESHNNDGPPGTPAPHGDRRPHGQAMQATVMMTPEIGNGHDRSIQGCADRHTPESPDEADPPHLADPTEPEQPDDDSDEAADWLLALAADQPTGDN